MAKKFKLLNITKRDEQFHSELGIPSGLKRIKALVDLPRRGVKAGDLGGYIESEDNLSHEGECWVTEGAVVYENAQVTGDAYIDGFARVYGNAVVTDNAQTLEEPHICGDIYIGGDVVVECSVVLSAPIRIVGEVTIEENDLY